MYDYRRGGGVLGSFLLGGLIGAALGVLFAPRSGRETRELLADSAQGYWNQGMEMYETGVTKATEAYSSGKEVAAEKADELRGKIDEARNRLKEQVEVASDTARSKVVETVPAAKDVVSKAGDTVRTATDTAEKKAQGALDFVADKAKKDEGVAETAAPAGTPLTDI